MEHITGQKMKSQKTVRSWAESNRRYRNNLVSESDVITPTLQDQFVIFIVK